MSHVNMHRKELVHLFQAIEKDLDLLSTLGVDKGMVKKTNAHLKELCKMLAQHCVEKWFSKRN